MVADIFEVGTKWQTEVKSQGSDCRHASPYLARRQDYFHIFRRPNLHTYSRAMKESILVFSFLFSRICYRRQFLGLELKVAN